MSSHRLRSVGVALLGLAALVAPRRSAAQLAPTGNHYGARPSDTGFEPGGPNALGGYSTSIPLSLPPARGQLPVPVSVVYGVHGAGAAGVGWDVPFYYLQINGSLNHRRPALYADAAPQARVRVNVVIPGRGRVDMVLKSTLVWTGRADGADLTLKPAAAGDTGWVLTDGAGRTYKFKTLIPDSGLFLLDSISAAGGGEVAMTYSPITDVLLGPSTTPAKSIDLLNVRYDPNPTTTGCYKYEIDLSYAAATPTAKVIGAVAMARPDKLVKIDVTSRSTCTTAALSLRHYDLYYQIDLDTRLSQLASVTMSGRQGTAEATTPIPIATYGYGTATYTDVPGSWPAMRYQTSAQTVALPPSAGYISATAALPPLILPLPSSNNAYATWQSLTDVTGDGRADFIYVANDQPYIARNIPGPNGTSQFGPGTPLFNGPLGLGFFEERGSKYARFSTSQTSGSYNVDYEWRKAIDFNGDGRIDIVDAAEKPGHWTVYLNTPDASGQGITWVRRSVRVDTLYKHMTTDDHLDLHDGYVPLSRRYTATAYEEWVCWVNSNGVVTQDTRPFPNACPYPTGTLDKLGESTHVEWELKDVNGDGYPDMVMNSSPMQFVPSPVPQPYQVPVGTHNADKRTWTPQPADDATYSNRVDVALNVRGIFLSNDPTDFNPFSSPVPYVQNGYCGVSTWVDSTDGSSDVQTLGCDITDVNGDGIADRVDSVGNLAPESGLPWGDTVVALGTGSSFLPAMLTLPNHLPIASQRSQQPGVCAGASGSTTFVARTATALRDLTGDGIPDLVHYDNVYNIWVVYVGTGTGFNTTPNPIQVQGAAFGLSETVESCDGSVSYTSGGLFDMDGDGKPEVLWRSGNNVTVSRLVGNSTPGTPEAGRLVSINNGYGATTGITYRSAKEDPKMWHQVPFPEIVATDIETFTAGGRLLSGARYAYGGATMMYDQELDAYRMPTYGRSIELRAVPNPVDKPNALATVTDTYGLDSFDSTASEADRFGRYLRAGRVSDSTVLGVIGANDPWALLDVNTYGDTRRLSGTHYTYTPRVYNADPTVAASEDADDFCSDVVDALDFDATAQGLNAGSFDPCSARGFMYTQRIDSWRGNPPPSANGVATAISIISVDDYARPTTILYSNDVNRSDDDYCVDTTFATPTGSTAPVLTAPSSRKTYDCTKGSTNAVFAYESFEYDKLPLGSVGVGHLTGHNVERHATDTGAVLASFRDFDVSYDAAGNPSSVVRTREDGSRRTATIVYDAFDIAPARVVTSGTGAPTLNTNYTLDPYSLDVNETRDPNNAMRGTQYDGFGRPKMTTFRQLGGTLMALSSLSYLGDTDGTGRRVVFKQFTDPVATTAVTTAAGRTSTTYLDEIGRETVTNVTLGSDYSAMLIVGARTYDSLGRVIFEADPYLSSQDYASAYGTTRYFNIDGSPSVFLRGRGQQPLLLTPDPTVERYPTIYRHSFASYQESLSVQQPDSLTNPSPQYGVLRAEIRSAIGRVLFRSTWQNGARLEHEQLNYDRVGQHTAFVRFGDPAGATLPVQTTTSHDSLGHLVQMQEPGGAVQKRTFSNFDELKEIDFIPGGTEPMHSLLRKFDALGRMVHAEEQNGGVTDADTVYDYGYDTANSPTTSVTPTNVLGRLTIAKAPTGGHYFSYDNYGNINASVFTDESATYYIERDSFHGDGSRASLELDLPDHAYTAERVDYGYDSAGRVHSMLYSDGTSSTALYTALSVDAWGRLRKGIFGETNYVAEYDNLGRRLFKSVAMSSAGQTRSVVVNSYDAVGRELSRTQQGRTNGTTVSAYDALGRLATSVKSDPTTTPPTTLANWSYGYDALGNISGLNDYVGNKDAAISYGTTDRDQMCRINYGAFGLACNVTHDSFGNVVFEATRTGSRKMTYYNDGQARRIDDSAGSSVTMKYDPFGREQELDLAAGGETRSDRHYGAHIYKRYQVAGPLKANYIGRQFPGPDVLVSRRGVGGPWVYSFQEARGVRFSADDKGTFVQDVDYEPFGEATSMGAGAGDPAYSPDQFNGGDALGAVGLVHVGARLYDPVIGRFLSRDPLFRPRTATTTNPYAFADNDPVGHSDPTGLCTEGDPSSCSSWWPVILPFGGGGGSGGSGSSGGGLFNGYKIPTPQPHQSLTQPQQAPDPSDDSDTMWKGIGRADTLFTLTSGPIGDKLLDGTWDLIEDGAGSARSLFGGYTSLLLLGHSVATNWSKGFWAGGLQIWGDAGGTFLTFYGGAPGWVAVQGLKGTGWLMGTGAAMAWRPLDLVEQMQSLEQQERYAQKVQDAHQKQLALQQAVKDQQNAAAAAKIVQNLSDALQLESSNGLSSYGPFCSDTNGSLTDALEYKCVAQ